jgi:hypothetical protein
MTQHGSLLTWFNEYCVLGMWAMVMLMGSFIRQTWLLPRWIERGRVKEGNMRNFYHFANPVDQLWRDTFD